MADKLMKKIADAVDIPADVISATPKITLTGDTRALIENHRGLLEYGGEMISINGGGMTLKLRGDGLELRAMTKREILISGHIWAVELE